MAVEVDISQVQAIAKQIAGGEAIFERHMLAAMHRVTAVIQHDAMVAVPVDTGNLRRSIATIVDVEEGRVGTNLLYGLVVEVGRKAGSAWPPPGALIDWMRRHGIPQQQEYIIRKRIGEHGTPARPYLKPALEANRADIQKEFAAAALASLKEMTA